MGKFGVLLVIVAVIVAAFLKYQFSIRERACHPDFSVLYLEHLVYLRNQKSEVYLSYIRLFPGK